MTGKYFSTNFYIGIFDYNELEDTLKELRIRSVDVQDVSCNQKRRFELQLEAMGEYEKKTLVEVLKNKCSDNAYDELVESVETFNFLIIGEVEWCKIN